MNHSSSTASSDTASTADTNEDPSSSNSKSSKSSFSNDAGCSLQLTEMRVDAYASQAVRAAASLVRQRSVRLDAAALALEKLSLATLRDATQKSPVEHAIDRIWQLGLEFPESGLVPGDDSDRIRMLQFLYTWAIRIVPALLVQSSDGSARASDLATLSGWISLQRRRHTKSRGPFWNGRMPSAAEIVVAPFADTLLHSNVIPDSQEYGSLAAWLAALRALPQLSDAHI
ncbi:hypothetical protein GGF39_003259 [Coemansia sp. RSA 1721]|nr:hypothetical protein GGF39_003259 [Coemansia sp. RSA 1721]